MGGPVEFTERVRNLIRGLRQDPEVARVRLACFTAAVVFNFAEAGFRMESPIWQVFLIAAAIAPRPVSPGVAMVPMVAKNEPMPVARTGGMSQ